MQPQNSSGISSTDQWTERFNQTFCHSLVNDDRDQKLESTLVWLSSSQTPTTGHSSFFMLYHREALLPIDIELMPADDRNDVEPSDDYIR